MFTKNPLQFSTVTSEMSIYEMIYMWKVSLFNKCSYLCTYYATHIPHIPLYRSHAPTAVNRIHAIRMQCHPICSGDREPVVFRKNNLRQQTGPCIGVPFLYSTKRKRQMVQFGKGSAGLLLHLRTRQHESHEPFFQKNRRTAGCIFRKNEGTLPDSLDFSPAKQGIFARFRHCRYNNKEKTDQTDLQDASGKTFFRDRHSL